MPRITSNIGATLKGEQILSFKRNPCGKEAKLMLLYSFLQNAFYLAPDKIFFFNFSTKKYEPAPDKTNRMACACSKDSDQPGHPPSPISLCFRHEESLGPYLPAGLGGSVGCAVRLETRRSRVQHSFVEIDHEIFSTVILSLPLIQEGQLSVSGGRMCTILVNRLED